MIHRPSRASDYHWGTMRLALAPLDTVMYYEACRLDVEDLR